MAPAPASTPAVLYAAKSTEDTHGSIPTQLEDCRAAVLQAGNRTVIGEYQDEAASAYKGNRGPGLQAAKNAAVEAAHGGSAELWVQHSDRLARGDGKRADHLVEVWLEMRKAGVQLRSVQDDSNLENIVMAVLVGERNHQDSDRKGAAVAAGLKRRAERGEPVGRIPFGYRAEATIENGKAVTRRVRVPGQAAIVERIFTLVEAGHTFGDVTRTLNAEQIPDASAIWTTRKVRRIALNEDYTGSTGYPQLIDPARHARIVASVKRLDPVAVQARKGGRQPVEPYLLRGIAFCKCGAALYTRRYASGRHYICAAVREARGTCECAPIPAEFVERAVIDHLASFLGDVEAWIAEKATEDNSDRARFADAVDGQRRELQRLRVRAQRAHETYAKLLDDADELAHDALRAAARMDAEAGELSKTLEACAQRLEDWPTAPAVDAALDYYTQLRDGIAGRLSGAASVTETNAALRAVIEHAQLIYVDDTHLRGRFYLRDSDRRGLIAGLGRRTQMTFYTPPSVGLIASLGDGESPELQPEDTVAWWRQMAASQTEPQTFRVRPSRGLADLLVGVPERLQPQRPAAPRA